jgi:hypothetical protein
MSWVCAMCAYPSNPDARDDCFKCGAPKPVTASLLDPPQVHDMRHMDYEPKSPSLRYLLNLGYKSNAEMDSRDYSTLLRIANMCNWISVTIVQLSLLSAILLLLAECFSYVKYDMLQIVLMETAIIGNAVIEWIVFQGACRLIILAINVAEDIEAAKLGAVAQRENRRV